jgi:hypothetical protein
LPNRVGADDGVEFHQASAARDLVAVLRPLFQPRALKTSVVVGRKAFLDNANWIYQQAQLSRIF